MILTRRYKKDSYTSIDKKHTGMKKYIVISISLLLAAAAGAQQDAQYTQFMFNKMALNPAFAGNWDATAITALSRSQWSGFEGAPNTQSVTVNSAIGSNIGAGLMVMHDNIGATDSWSVAGAYAYKLKLAKGQLSLGLQAGVRRHEVSWNELSPSESGDPLASLQENTTLAPTFGVGIYYQQKKYYVGLSVPTLNQYSLNEIGQSQVPTTSVQQRHYYLMAGGLLFDTDRFKIKMAGLMKYTQTSPLDVDLHTSLIFADKLWAGVTLRHGGFRSNDNVLESADLVLQYQFTDGLRVGLAYDISLTELSQYNSGSYEMMAFFQPFLKKNAVQNPRFF